MWARGAPHGPAMAFCAALGMRPSRERLGGRIGARFPVQHDPVNSEGVGGQAGQLTLGAFLELRPLLRAARVLGETLRKVWASVEAPSL